MRDSFSFPRAGTWIGPALLALLATGCGYDPFAPPSRPTTRPTNDAIESTKTVFMIVPGKPEGDAEIWAIWAQREVNDHHMAFRAMAPPPGDATMTESEMVRKALADGASGLIVVPDDSKDLAQTLADVEAKGTPIALIGATVPAPAGSRPFTCFTHAPREEWAVRIVATTLEDAKKAGRPADGTALIVADKYPDSTSESRVAVLKAEAAKAGLKSVETVSYDGTETGAAKKAVLEAVQSHPNVAIVLTVDGEGMKGASEARVELKGKPVFFVGGFTGYRPEASSLNFSKESCYVDGKVEQLGQMAALNIIARLRNEPVDERTTPKLELTRGSAEVAAEEPAAGRVQPKAMQPPPTGAAKP